MNRSSRTVIKGKKRIAFVCSGGAAKAGAFHLGVALALKEKGFSFVGGIEKPTPVFRSSRLETESSHEIGIYVGSSAGSLITTFLAAGYSLDQVFDSFLKNGKQRRRSDAKDKILKPLTYYELYAQGLMSSKPLREHFTRAALSAFKENLSQRIKGFRSGHILPLTSLFTTDGIERYLRNDILPSNDYRHYKADLFSVATQLNHSRKVVFCRHSHAPTPEDRNCIYSDEVEISKAVAASTSLPPIFAPYPITNSRGRTTYYFDGEIRDTLSIHVAADHQADLIIASYTHQPYRYTSEIGSLHHFGIPAILIQALYLMIERKIQQYRQFKDRSRVTYDAVSEFLKENGVPKAKREACLALIEKKLMFRRDMDTLYIHPSPSDHEMFFGDHFNLNPDKLKELVRIGFRSAIRVLRRYDFQN